MSGFTNVYCCLYDLNSQADLILDGCSAQVLIADVHASVTLSQRFTSPGHWLNAASGVYTFGIMADAAVCGFEMVQQDGTKIEGTVKEKWAAKCKYDQAVMAGHTASLGQQETADVFSVTVGNILPSETVTINLQYILPLIDDEKRDQIKFIFPRTYAQRYGAAPTYNSGIGKMAHQPFQMNVVVQQAGAIKSISCPSGHPISLELGIPENLAPPNQTSSSHFASVSLTDTTGFLTQDVVLVISAVGLDGPRCFIERHPDPNHESAAMALTFVPKFNLPDVSGGMEYVFLVDRSASMNWMNIQLVREALIVLLQGLPSIGTTFNIVSFGSKATKLWKNSQAYSQMTLEEATNHVDSMQADYSGTHIAEALRIVYDSLPKPLQCPVAVLLLTDGSAWDVPTCMEYTRSALNTLPQPGNANSFMCVFTVGIGNGASSDTCESIARAGGGMAVYVKQGEALVGKCTRLVRAARTPEVKVKVDWGVRVEDDDDDDFVVIEDLQRVWVSTLPAKTAIGTISLFADDNDPQQLHPTGPPPRPNPTLPPPPLIQQSPLIIPSIFPGTRTQVYAILRIPKEVDNGLLPVMIKIKGIVSTTGDSVELVVLVSPVLQSPIGLGSDSQPASSGFSGTFLHTLAAKALIRDREQGKHAFPPSVSASFKGDNVNAEIKAVYLKKEVIRLGTAYGLASKHTSFVAVDHREQRIIPVVVESNPYKELHAALEKKNKNKNKNKKKLVTNFLPVSPGGSQAQPAPLPSLQPLPMISTQRARRATAPPPPSAPAPPLYALCNFASSHSGEDFGGFFSASSLESVSTGYTPAPPAASTITTNPFISTSTPITASTLIASIARLQQWHGGFLLSDSLLHFLGHALDLKDAQAHQPFSADAFEQRLAYDGIFHRKKRSDESVTYFMYIVVCVATTYFNIIKFMYSSASEYRYVTGTYARFWQSSHGLPKTFGFERTNSALEELRNNGVNRDVGATLVALLWMERYGGEEVLDMREKAIEWVNGVVGQERADVIKKWILDSSELYTKLRSESGPSAVQPQDIENMILLCDRDYEDYELEVARLESQIWYIREQQKRLEDHKKKLGSLRSPIRKLPNETLQSIFDYACDWNLLQEFPWFLESDPPTIISSSPMAYLPASSISATCSRWRSVSNAFTDALELYLGRSKEYPLMINLQVSDDSDRTLLYPDIPAWILLLRHSQRWKVFQHIGEWILEANNVHEIVEFSLLEEIRMEQTNLDEDEMFYFGDAPKLRDLDIFDPERLDVERLGEHSWRQITHLNVPAMHWPLEEIMNFSPNLTSLTLWESYGNPTISLALPRTYNRLSSLRLKVFDSTADTSLTEHILSSFTFPSLLELHVEAVGTPYTQVWPRRVFSAFMARSSCSITKISFQHIPISHSDLNSVLYLLPCLHDFSINNHGVLGSETITSSFISSLHSSGRSELTGSSSPLVPRLRYLSLEFEGADFDDAAFISTVASRWLPDPDYAVRVGVDCLRSVVLKFLSREVDETVYKPLRNLDRMGLMLVLTDTNRS
ncbi:hypothetical protein BT96DRAFT_980927 [Gymnopus androsaceus JB14]|uniref:VWFA domain-containing protein n=1 Tax=Gymnopus androsaceus JB14 TaxID=1447944 RepID=A0A6A4GTI4_9AGAR|nr:hypothetical protein BT96DRAFT_980927 [Gymnopus androsaceus JB14]